MLPAPGRATNEHTCVRRETEGASSAPPTTQGRCYSSLDTPRLRASGSRPTSDTGCLCQPQNPSHSYLRELPIRSGPDHAVYRSPLVPGRCRRRSERRFRRSNVTTRRAGLRQRGSRTRDHDRRVHGGARRIEVQASHRSVQLLDRFLFDCSTGGDLIIEMKMETCKREINNWRVNQQRVRAKGAKKGMQAQGWEVGGGGGEE